MRKTYAKESHVKDDVKALLNRYNYFWFMPPANGYGASGISDFIALKGGVFLAIETKFGSNKPTPLQVGFLNSIRAEKGFAFVVNEKNLDWLDAFLDSFQVAAIAASQGMEVSPDHGARIINAMAELSNKLLDVGTVDPSVDLVADGPPNPPSATLQ
jgi:hypothetical protein